MTETVERLWRSLSSGLLGWFRARGASAAEAEDLLSETFLRVQRSIGEVRDDARYVAWVYRLARNVWIDRSRSREVPGALVEEPSQDEQEVELNREVASWLEPALVNLGDDLTAQVLRRTELGGEKQADVARDLGLSLGAVKARVRRGRQQMRAELEACCAFEFDRRGGIVDVRRRSGAGDSTCDC